MADRIDSSGSGINLDEVGTVSSTAGVAGNAASFDGTDGNYLEAFNAANFSFGDTTFSVTFFVRIDTDLEVCLAGRYNAESDERGWVVRKTAVGSGGLIQLAVSSDGLATGETTVDGSAVTLGQTYFVAVFHDADTNEIGLSVDDAAYTTTAHTGGVFAGGTTRFRVGAYGDPTPAQRFPLTGFIDKLFFFKRRLSAQDTTALYEEGEGITLAGWNSYVVTGVSGRLASAIAQAAVNLQITQAQVQAVVDTYYWWDGSRTSNLRTSGGVRPNQGELVDEIDSITVNASTVELRGGDGAVVRDGYLEFAGDRYGNRVGETLPTNAYFTVILVAEDMNRNEDRRYLATGPTPGQNHWRLFRFVSGNFMALGGGGEQQSTTAIDGGKRVFSWDIDATTVDFRQDGTSLSLLATNEITTPVNDSFGVFGNRNPAGGNTANAPAGNVFGLLYGTENTDIAIMEQVVGLYYGLSIPFASAEPSPFTVAPLAHYRLEGEPYESEIASTPTLQKAGFSTGNEGAGISGGNSYQQDSNGSTNYLFSDDSFFQFGANTTIAITGWVYVDSVQPTTTSPPTSVNIFSRDVPQQGQDASGPGLHENSYKLNFVDNSDNISWQISSDGTLGTASVITSQANSCPKEQWNFFYCYYDAVNDQMGLKINNLAVSTLSHANGFFQASTREFRIAQAHTVSTGLQNPENILVMKGRVDELSFWDYLLTDEQLTYLYNSGNGRLYSQLGF